MTGWNIANLTSILIYFIFYIKSEHLKTNQKMQVVIHTFFLVIANFHYGANVYLCSFSVFMIVYGIFIKYLNKIDELKDDKFNVYFGLSVGWPYLFWLPMVFSWAGIQ